MDYSGASEHYLSARSTHRAPAISLPADPDTAAAYVLSFVQSADSAFDRSAAIEGMHDRITQIQDSSSNTVERELYAHSQVLQALFMRYAASAITATGAEHKAIFTKLAIACQAAYMKTVVCVEGLRLQWQGQGSIRVNEHESQDQQG